MARRIEVSAEVAAPIDEVWADLARLENHSEWMKDAEAIEFLSEQHTGAGTKIRVPTRIGPLTTVDEIEFTEWEPPHRMAIVHRGKFTGVGAISLAATVGGTTVTWSEEIRFPALFLGPLGEVVAAPMLRWVWKTNLKRLADRFK